MMKLGTKKKLLALASVAGLGLGTLAAAPAHAAGGDVISICNSYYSVDDIWVYGPYITDRAVNQGACAYDLDDTGNSIRVDVDLGGHEGDVDSWEKGVSGYGPPCYNNEESASNPYSAYYKEMTMYKTWSHLNC